MVNVNVSPDTIGKLIEPCRATGEPSVMVIVEAASILIVCPTTPSSKSVIAVVPAVMKASPVTTVGVASVDVNVIVVPALTPVTVAVPPTKFHEPSTK